IIKDRMRLLKRHTQIDRSLIELDEEMDGLLENARKKAAEIRGESGVPVRVRTEGRRGSREKMVLGY
ncbi:MAG: hypothetical protein AAB972_03385, partial [Patescibacteria group bacterium]